MTPAVREEGGGAGAIMASALAVAAANYVFGFALVWLLSPRDYAIFGTGQALLLVAGTAASSSAPLVLSRELAVAGDHAERRRSALAFAMVFALGQGIVTALVIWLISRRDMSSMTQAVLVTSTLLLFFSTLAIGHLQGDQCIRGIALLRVGEVATKIAAGVLLVVATALGSAGALAGFGVGSIILLLFCAPAVVRDFPPAWGAVRERRLWTAAAGLASVQVLVAVLASLAIVVCSLTLGVCTALAQYQVAATLTRAPLFVSAALSLAAFPALAAVRPELRQWLVAQNLAAFVRCAVPLAAVTATLPAMLIHWVAPPAYDTVGRILPWTAVSGVALGLINLTTTFFQATGNVKRVARGLTAFAVVATLGLVLGAQSSDITILAAVEAITMSAVAAWMLRRVRSAWPGSLHDFLGGMALTVGCAVALIALHPWLLAWAPVAAFTLLVAALDFRRMNKAEKPSVERTDSMRILHLAFEDHRKPGAGGGSVRTHEINRRLAARHDVTVVTAKYPGWEDRVEDGVRYVHVGCGTGRVSAGLSYFAALPRVLRRRPADLVVEDFAAPFSTACTPLFTRRPVVGMVQWFFAAEKSRQYKLPFVVVERVGVRLYRRLIAVSDDLATTLREAAPKARVDVIDNGLQPEAFVERPSERSGIVFLGRLDMAHKGLDLLIDAYSRLRADNPHRLTIAGDGPDLDKVRQLAERHGLADRVTFAGRVIDEAKWRLLASASVVAMPSRYETFGIVAAEALAVGTPVVAFDIPCLRGVLPDAAGRKVPVGDVAAFTNALSEVLANPHAGKRMGAAGRKYVRRFNWDELASRQETVYADVLAEAVPTGRPRRFAKAALSGPAPADMVPESVPLATSGVLERLRTNRRPPRVLLVGNYGNGNTGDEAICSGLLEVLRPRADVTVVSRNPEDVRALHRVDAVRTTSLSAAWALLRADVVGIGGGGIFGRGIPLLPALLPIVARLARLVGVRSCFLAIGVYPDAPSWVLKHVRKLARQSLFVTVRDVESYRTMHGHGEVLLVRDPGMDLTPAPAQAARSAMRDAGLSGERPILGLSFKASPAPATIAKGRECLVEAARAWTTMGGDVLVLAFSDQPDYNLDGRAPADADLQQVIENAALPRPALLGPHMQPALAKAVISQCAATVAMRLHAQMFAVSVGTPLFALPFETKSESFVTSAGAQAAPLDAVRSRAVADWVQRRYPSTGGVPAQVAVTGHQAVAGASR